jgi:outer membrane protein assembly factor BamB
MNGTVKWKEQPLTLLYHIAGKNFYTRGAYNEVTCRDWETGEIKWTRSFSGIYDYIQQFPSPHTIKSTVTRFICETDGVLWIALSSGRLVGLNKNSGEEVYNISNPANFPAGYQLRKEDEYLHYGLYMNFDKNSDMLFGLRGKYYFEIGLNDPVHNYSIYDIKQELHTAGFEEINFSGDGYQQAWHKNEIYFGQQDRKGPTIGIFERESKHIAWVSGLPASNSYIPNIRKIGYAGNKLYALDGNQVLHIYSR